MNKSSAQHNLESLTLIAHRLEELCDDVTFAGGCITGLLITDKAAPDFIATKLEAFKDRGKHDFLLSHDLEDIISLIDGRPEIVTDIAIVSDDLKQYLAFEFASLMNNLLFIQALPGHLNDSDQSDSRLKIVKTRIMNFLDNLKIRVGGAEYYKPEVQGVMTV